MKLAASPLNSLGKVVFKQYSRGNDDTTENIYETARIFLMLSVDCHECKCDAQGKHTGDCHVTIYYSARLSTKDPKSLEIGKTYALVDPEIQYPNKGSFKRLEWLPPKGDPNAAKDGSFDAEWQADDIPCKEGRVAGELDVQRLNGASLGLIQHTINYTATVYHGFVKKADMSAVNNVADFNGAPGTLGPGGAASPFREIPPQEPFPPYPGIKR